jgi:hypothetical protein
MEADSVKETYTAEDGTTFSTREDCVAYERIIETLSGYYKEQDGTAECLGLQPMFVYYLKQGFYSVQELMAYRTDIKILSALLNPDSETKPNT